MLVAKAPGQDWQFVTEAGDLQDIPAHFVPAVEALIRMAGRPLPEAEFQARLSSRAEPAF